uniref:Uncharacterized protein n=1 Tax=Panagrolaimus davidi TaxID=227884 RepID=A0A914PTB3_9BILA
MKIIFVIVFCLIFYTQFSLQQPINAVTQNKTDKINPAINTFKAPAINEFANHVVDNMAAKIDIPKQRNKRGLKKFFKKLGHSVEKRIKENLPLIVSGTVQKMG